MEERTEILGAIRVTIEDYKRLVYQYNIVVADKRSIWTEAIHRKAQIAKLKRKIKLLKHDIKELHKTLSFYDSITK